MLRVETNSGKEEGRGKSSTVGIGTLAGQATTNVTKKKTLCAGRSPETWVGHPTGGIKRGKISRKRTGKLYPQTRGERPLQKGQVPCAISRLEGGVEQGCRIVGTKEKKEQPKGSKGGATKPVCQGAPLSGFGAVLPRIG